MKISGTPDFEKGLIPAIIQDYYTKNILMLGYMNEDAWHKTRETGKATFYSRSREKLWTKGETSGNYLDVKSMKLDCDNDAILVEAIPSGPVCHTGSATCFSDINKSADLSFLEEVINKRYSEPAEGSYTSQLFSSGINKIAQKVGEEAVELVIESKDENDELFINEAADLMFHYLVLLKSKGFSLTDVAEVLRKRHK
jgi:phosphoribosyl-ATP pyrophosphohydrolase/phosphoribosyl-AMP cyclohydrolase